MYCGLPDISPIVSNEKLERMLEPGNTGGVATIEDAVNGAIQFADNKINTALGGIYTLPISGTQSLMIVKGISVALAVESLYNYNEDGKTPERIKQEADQAREELKAYGSREKYLPDAPRQKSFVVKAPCASEASDALSAN